MHLFILLPFSKSNRPITPEAHDYLVAQGKVVIPDLLLNAGGVTVSYFEVKDSTMVFSSNGHAR